MAFVDNSSTVRKLVDQDVQREIALCLSVGIENYFSG